MTTCEPTVIAGVVICATPLLSGADPTGLPATLNWTISPSGGGPAIDDTVTVNVTACPRLDGFAEEITVAIIFGLRIDNPALLEIAITPKSLIWMECGCRDLEMGASAVRSCMPAEGVHRNAWRIPFLALGSEVPTIHPLLLMPRAELVGPPRVPRSVMRAPCVQENA